MCTFERSQSQDCSRGIFSSFFFLKLSSMTSFTLGRGDHWKYWPQPLPCWPEQPLCRVPYQGRNSQTIGGHCQQFEHSSPSGWQQLPAIGKLLPKSPAKGKLGLLELPCSFHLIATFVSLKKVDFVHASMYLYNFHDETVLGMDLFPSLQALGTLSYNKEIVFLFFLG